MANSHPIRNRISLGIPADDQQAVQAAFQTLIEKLHPHLLSLVPDERREMAKMGPRTSDFVNSTMGYMRAMPQYLPGFVDIEEFQRDLDAVRLLRAFQHQLDQCGDMVGDSLMLAGSEAYAAALSCYDALKTAAKHGSPEAVAAVSDLAERLPQRGAAKAAVAVTGAPVVTIGAGAASA